MAIGPFEANMKIERELARIEQRKKDREAKGETKPPQSKPAASKETPSPKHTQTPKHPKDK